MNAVHTHLVRFYENDRVLVHALHGYVADGLKAGESAVIVATGEHHHALRRLLEADGIDVAGLAERGSYVALDAATTLSRIMAGDVPDRSRFQSVVGSVVRDAVQLGAPVRAFGEMVGLLANAARYPAATSLEELWNELQNEHDFTLLCAYRSDLLPAETPTRFMDSVCDLHSAVLPPESSAIPTDSNERLRTIVQLQQKARALEFEVAARERAEERLRFALSSEHAALEAADGARATAEAALRSRDEFLSIAAHELRTPMTTLLGNVQLLRRKFDRDGVVPPDVAALMLSQVGDAATKLSQLVGQLLDVSRIQAGRLSLEPQEMDLSAVVRAFAEAVPTWDQTHQINVEAPATLLIDGDPIRLEQVITNLVQNALKYSPPGSSIDVSLCVLEQRRPLSVELAVQDAGIGIPLDSRPYIFDRFFQAHPDDHRGGLGLGLYVCRQIVELHGGEIVAEFPPEGGTRIVVRLPARTVAAVGVAAGETTRMP